MEKILEITVGDGHVQSGLLPLDAVELMEALLAALEEEGLDPEIVKKSNPHIAIVSANSTRTALYGNNGKRFKKPLASLRKKLGSCRVGPKGRDFVDRATSSTSTWGYAELDTRHLEKRAKVLRFDSAYRDRFQKKTQLNTIAGTDEIYARIIRAGGERPTAKLEMLNGESDTYSVRSRDLAKKLAKQLYEVVKLTAEVTWDRKTLEVVDLTVTGIDEDWKDIHLGDLIEESGGVLPIKSSFLSVEALIAGRREEEKG